MDLGDLSTVVMVTAATLTAFGVLVRQRPARWLGRTLVKDPVMTALRREVRAVVVEVVDERLDARPLTNGVGWATVQAIAEHLGITVTDHRVGHDERATEAGISVDHPPEGDS